ncbi:MAG: hypothetical protein MJK15_00870 [Colwellia sp.]|nr:hypothetical protein [Colwellia sp.]
MANDYYVAPAAKTPLTTIRSSVRNNDAAAVEAGFDVLPAELDIKRTQYGDDTSASAALYEITIPNLDVAYYEGLDVTFQAKFENTGVANISVNGGANVKIVNTAGDDILAGSIKVDQAVSVVYVVSPAPNFQLISTAATSQDIQDAKDAADAAEASAAAAAISADEAEAAAAEALAVAQGVTCQSKSSFLQMAEKRRRVSAGSGDSHEKMEFSDFYTTPATVANQLTLEQRFREVNGVLFNASQTTLALPAASAVDTLLSNQTIIMFDTDENDISATDNFFIKGDKSTAPIAWAALDDATRLGYKQDPENNIYLDGTATIQRTWEYVITNLAQDYVKGDPQAIIDAGYTQGTLGDTFITWTKGTVVAVTISQIQRRNQGAYEPEFNSNGTAEFGDALPWYSTTDARASTADCFISVGDGSIVGAASGRVDGKFFDAVDASDIFDLRMSSKRLPYDEIRETHIRKAISAEIRGFEGVPFTIVDLTPVQTVAGTAESVTVNDLSPYTIGDTVDIVSAAGVVEVVNARLTTITGLIGWTGQGKEFSRTAQQYHVVHATPQLHAQANPSWTGIIGDPVRVTATYPNGVEGRWIPPIPDATTQTWNLTRESLSADVTSEFTLDDGVSWTTDVRAIDVITNSYDLAQNALIVRLDHYEIKAHFTEDAINGEPIATGDVFATNDNNASNGNLLLSSLIGKVGVGDAEPRNLEVSLIGKGSIRGGVLTPIAGNELTHTTLALGAITNPAVKVRDTLTVTADSVASLQLTYKEMVYDVTRSVVTDFTEVSGSGVFNFIVGDTYYFNNIDFHGYRGGVYTCRRAISNTPLVISTLTTEQSTGDITGESSGVMQLFFEVWDGNGWGDNNKFEIADNQNALTDLNDNSALYGTAITKLQFYIVET